MMIRTWPTVLAVVTLALPLPALAVVTRHDTALVAPSRYENLAAQDRFNSSVALRYQYFDEATSKFRLIAGGGGIGCSGTMVSASVVLTAAHCFRIGDIAVPDTGTGLVSTSGVLPIYFKTSFVMGQGAAASTQTLTIKKIELHPSWNPSTKEGTDLALVRITDAVGKPVTTYLDKGVPESIQFHPILGSQIEFSEPSPYLAIHVGYGNQGNGQIGELKNTTGFRLAGLNVIEGASVSSGQSILTTIFNSPSQIIAAGLPSNFLEAGGAHGDSGGGLFQTIGGVMYQTGVTSTLQPDLTSWFSNVLFGTKYVDISNVYGATSQYTRLSDPAVSSWISSTSASLGALVIPSAPGATAADPVDPVVSKELSPGETLKGFLFSVLPGTAIFLDPPVSSQVEYSIDAGGAVTAFQLPGGIGDNTFELFVFDEATGTFVLVGTATGGEWVTLATPTRRFLIKGIEGSHSEFVTGLKFDAGGDVAMSMLITAVPEPSTYVLLIVGMSMVCFVAARSRRANAV